MLLNRLIFVSICNGILFAGTALCQNGTLSCTVLSNHDGDTLTTSCNGVRRQVRVSSVDAPELKQIYGPESQQFVEGLTQNQTVILTVHDIDKYGRTVASVTLPDGRDLAREVVGAGLAWHYVKYSKDPGLAELESAARASRLGLWAQAVPEPPSAFRHPAASSVAEPARHIHRGERRSERRTLVARR